MNGGQYQYRHGGLVKVWLVIFCAVCATGRMTCVPPEEVDLNVTPDTQATDQPSRASHIKSGPARFDSLFQYFQAANPDLFSRFEALQKLYEKGKDHRGVTYVAGTSGVGKSYVVRNVAMFDKAVTETVKLSTIFTETLPDLQTLDGKVVFNRLPSGTAFDVQGLVEAMDPGKAFVLIDDLDEVREQTAEVILKALDTYVAKPGTGFKHFIVFGRPESFWPWLHDSRQVTRGPLVLQGPEYLTEGDIAFRCQDYYGFKYDRAAPDAVINDVISQLNRFPFLGDTMRPLSAGNMVIEDSVARCSQNTAGSVLFNTDEAQKQRLFEQLVARNQRSHGRPGTDNLMYMRLLMNAARIPTTYGRTLDRRGFFTVRDMDLVSCADTQGRTREAYARDVLNRSGLVTMDLINTRVARYRFEPVWVRDFLVEMSRRPGL